MEPWRRAVTLASKQWGAFPRPRHASTRHRGEGLDGLIYRALLEVCSTDALLDYLLLSIYRKKNKPFGISRNARSACYSIGEKQQVTEMCQLAKQHV
jgi:hypothetical protein